MSKCQMNKYKAGGRCGGTSAPACASEGYTSAEFTAYLTKRQEQDRLFSGAGTAPACATKPESKAIVIQMPPRIDRKKDIDDILNGDFLE
jgi:hypothetical protein